MAQTSGKHTIGIDADTTHGVSEVDKFISALRGVNRQANAVRADADRMGSQVAKSATRMGDSLGDTAQSVDHLGDELKVTARAGDEAAQNLAKYSSGAEKSARQSDKLARALKEQNDELKKGKGAGAGDQASDPRAERERLRLVSQQLRVEAQLAKQEARARRERERAVDREKKDAQQLMRDAEKAAAARQRITSQRISDQDKIAKREERAQRQRERAIAKQLRDAQQIARAEERAARKRQQGLDGQARELANLERIKMQNAQKEIARIRKIHGIRQRAMQKRQAAERRAQDRKKQVVGGRLDVAGAASTNAALAGAAASAALMSAAVAGVTRELIGSARAAGKFDQQMRRTAAVTKNGEASFDALKQSAIDAGLSTAFSAQEAAQAQQLLAQAGFSASDQISALPEILRLSSAGNLELAETANLASNVLSVYGFKADQLGSVNDKLTGTFTRSNTTLQSLAKSFEFVGAQAKASGQSFEGTLAALGQLGNAGISADKAGTALRSALVSLEKTTPKAAATLKTLGIETRDSSGGLRQLVDILDDLKKSGASTTQILEIFGKVGGTGIQTLMGQGIPALRSFQKEINNSAGLTKKIEQSVLNTFEGKLQILFGTIDTGRILIGDKMIPALSGMTDELINQSSAFIKNDDNLKEFTNLGKDAVLIGASMAQMLALLIPRIAMLTGVLIEAGKQLGSMTEGVQKFQKFVPALIASDAILGQITGSMKENAAAGGEVGRSLEDATSLGDKMAKQMEQLSERLGMVGRGMDQQSSKQVPAMASAWDTATQAAGDYRIELGKTSISLRKIGFIAGVMAKDSKDAIAEFLGFKTELAKPVKTPARKKRRADRGAAQRARATRINEEAARKELQALQARDKIVRVGLKLEADMIRLRTRKMGQAQMELAQTRLRAAANDKIIAIIEKQEKLEARKKARLARAKSSLAIMKEGNVVRQSALQLTRDIWEIDQKKLEGDERRIALMQAEAAHITRLKDLEKKRADEAKKAAEERKRALELELQTFTDAQSRLTAAFSGIDDSKLGRVAQGLAKISAEAIKTTGQLRKMSDEGADADKMFVAGVQGASAAFAAAADSFGLSQRVKSGVLAAFYTAEGFGQASVGNVPGSVAAFTAAGLHGAIAGGVGGGGGAGAAASGGGGEASGGGFAERGSVTESQRQLARFIGEEMNNNGGGTTIIQVSADGAAFLGDGPRFTRMLGDVFQPVAARQLTDDQFRSRSRGSL